MDNSIITLLIRYFNILSTTVMAFFAIYGAIAIFGKKSALNIFRGRTFIQAFCAASLLAFVLEATVFNFQHYLKYFAGEEVQTLEISPNDSTIILTSDGTLVEHFSDIKDNDSTKSNSGGIVFKNLNKKVTSIFIEPVFDTAEFIAASIEAANGTYNNYRAAYVIYKGLPQTNYLTFHPYGEVSELKIYLHGSVSKVVINKQIPLYFSGLRLFTVSLLFLAIILFVHKELRQKTSYFLFGYKFDPSNKKQRLIYAFSVGLLIIFSFICAFTSVVEERPQAQQYNKYLVDALIEGRTHLEAGNPQKLLEAERPYNLKWLEENGYERFTDWMPDWVYYNGKFYCYFGAVPALMLYVPYKMITGNYLSNHAGIFLFIAVSVILMARLWRFFAKKYMKNAAFAFYLLSFFALFFASGLFNPLRFTRFYSIVAAAGFMFVLAGILLLFESVEREGKKPDRSKLFFACFCFALAVGCRPNLVFASLLVPVILWRYKLWRYLPLIAVPYAVVAVPICVYNYARFGSITDFGTYYNMTNLNLAAYSLLNPIDKIINTVTASVSYLFTVNNYSVFFPYVECVPQYFKPFAQIPRFYDKGCGMINFPIVFCLFYFLKSVFVKKARPKTFYISSAFLAVAAVLIFVSSWTIGFSGRYTLDFAIFIIFPSLFCAYFWCYENAAGNGGACEYKSRFRQKTVYVFLAASIFVGLFLFATSVTNDATPGNPSLYRYLQHSLVLFGVV